MDRLMLDLCYYRGIGVERMDIRWVTHLEDNFRYCGIGVERMNLR
ncbi:485_t:CDS:1, partial [Dentiscutata heterogama]